MPNLDVDYIRKILDEPTHVRNISIIASVGHGRSTVIDSLVFKNGVNILRRFHNDRYLDRQELGLNEATTPVKKLPNTSLYFEYTIQDSGKKTPYIINIIHSPNYVNISLDLNAILKVSDGVLVLLDSIQGVCVQTESLLRHALAQKIRPALMINKIDKAVLELQLDGESMYQSFLREINTINMVISSYGHPDMGDLQICPIKGTVMFGSGKQGWGLTLPQIAQIYSSKLNISANELVCKLWGENYFDPDSQTWTHHPQNESGRACKRGFVSFVMDPIIKLCLCIMERNKERINASLDTIGVVISNKEKELQGSPLLKIVLSKWINLADSMCKMFIIHLPSPKAAQRYRVSYLYEGSQHDVCAQSTRECDPKGPLMIYIFKTILTKDKKTSYVLGRLFSGTVSIGQKVRIVGYNNYKGSGRGEFSIKRVENIALTHGNSLRCFEDMPCGSIVALLWFERCFLKDGTISDHEEVCSIRSIKCSLSPLIRITVEPKDAINLPNFIESLRMLARSEPSITVTYEETGQHVIASSNKLHLEECLSDFQKEYFNFPVTCSDPFVCCKETISRKSQVCMTKSANRHNKFFITAEPLPEDLCELIEIGKLDLKDDPKLRSKQLAEEFGWRLNEGRRIWTFGPEDNSPNMLVDKTQAVCYMNEVKESCISAFRWATKEGVLCGENMTRVRIDIVDVILHTDAIHRGDGQVIPAVRRACYGSVLSGPPRLKEPICLVEIVTSEDVISKVYEVAEEIGGTNVEERDESGTCLKQVMFHLPLRHAFGEKYISLRCFIDIIRL